MDDGTNADDKMGPVSLPRIIKEEFSDEEIDKKPIISESGEGRIIISSISSLISLNFYIFFLFHSYKYKRGNFKRAR